MQADIFCRVIDNLGDIGVTWRLARQLHAEKRWDIRVWLDNLSALHKLEPTLDVSLKQQTLGGIEVHSWWPESSQGESQNWSEVVPRNTVIASFSCDLPAAYVGRMHPDSCWLQLEYLSAEPWVKGFHRQTSSRADGLRPVFFFPGFEKETGGLLREADLEKKRQSWQADRGKQKAWLQQLGVEVSPQTRLGSVFIYPTAPLSGLAHALAKDPAPTHLLVPDGLTLPSAFAAVPNKVTWQSIPFLSQQDYDKLLWSMDFNLVRGEDSFVRAIWAQRPFIWQAYPQTEGAHHAKIEAFFTQASLAQAFFPDAVKKTTHAWSDSLMAPEVNGLFKRPVWDAWEQACSALSTCLAQQADLASQIDAYCRAGDKSDLKTIE
jgi:uncharacterized repeat protein (TIGR03837 family)